MVCEKNTKWLTIPRWETILAQQIVRSIISVMVWTWHVPQFVMLLWRLWSPRWLGEMRLLEQAFKGDYPHLILTSGLCFPGGYHMMSLMVWPPLATDMVTGHWQNPCVSSSFLPRGAEILWNHGAKYMFPPLGSFLLGFHSCKESNERTYHGLNCPSSQSSSLHPGPMKTTKVLRKMDIWPCAPVKLWPKAS